MHYTASLFTAVRCCSNALGGAVLTLLLANAPWRITPRELRFADMVFAVLLLLLPLQVLTWCGLKAYTASRLTFRPA